MSDINTERYAMLLSYTKYENTMYWQRGQIFLLANTGLFGFLSANIPLFRTDTPIERAIIVIVVGIAGLFLCWLWKKSLEAGEFWIFHWEQILKQIEFEAWGDYRLLREFTPDPRSPKRVRARIIGRQAIYLFIVLWSIIILYATGVCLFLLCHCCCKLN
jgi:hypothetical protein